LGGLTLSLSDWRVEVDNNTVERSIRPIPLGRKNALFAGSDSGGDRWAILASLINTAKLHDIEPQAYLADVLDRMVSGRIKVNTLRELLPWNWRAARATAAAGLTGAA
jgi:transposase